jgi:RNA-binding protein YlmH
MQLLLHIKDMVMRTQKTSQTDFTFFLDESQRKLAEEYIKQFKDTVRFTFWGGYENAFRTVLAVSDLYHDPPIKEEFPFRCLTFEYKKGGLVHRDFLGACMSCMIKRNVIGDITVGDNRTQMFVYETCADVILNDVTSVAKIPVTVRDDISYEEKEHDFLMITKTVASLRADAVISAAVSVSREKSSELIKHGLVMLNGGLLGNVSYKLSQGDIFSVRKHGKYILKEINGTTKKGRIRISVEKYS